MGWGGFFSCIFSWTILYGGITKLLQFLGLALTHGWLDFHPPILGQMVGNPTNPRWNIHPMDGFPSSGWNSIHTGWISNRMDGNPTIRPSWPRFSGEYLLKYIQNLVIS